MAVFRGDLGFLNKPKKLDNGFLQADAFFTRVGVFEYRNRDGTVRRELRLPDEVFKPDSMSTFEMTPVTLGHPPHPVTAKNAKKYGVGHSGQDVRRDGDKMRGSIMVTDDDAIKAMKRGTRQISNGYFCDLEVKAGITQGIEGVEDGLAYDCIQRNIKGNHIAIVDHGRAGSGVEARVDAIIFDGVDEKFEPAVCQMRLDEADFGGDTVEPMVNDLTATMRKLAERQSKDGIEVFHLIGMVAWPIIHEMGLTVTEVAQSMSVGENEVEPILSGVVFPTGKQIDGLAVLLDVPAAELKDLLPERQRALTDGESTMEDFEITLNGVPFKFKGDASARMALTKALADGDAKADELTAKVKSLSTESATKIAELTARADMADEAKSKAEADRDAAVDPTAVRARIDARIALERGAMEVLGKDFDSAKTDEEIRCAVILKVQPNAVLDGRDAAYVAARFDGALEIFADNKPPAAPPSVAGIRRAAHNADGGAGQGGAVDIIAEAKARRDERNRTAWLQPMQASKDSVPEKVTMPR